jgi:hypothetical protein
MAQRDEIYVKAPVLLSPREEAVVDGRSVTFRWEPVEGALEYRLEVSEGFDFDALVYEQRIGQASSVTVEDVFASDDRTYFWRALARNEAGWSHGEVIESFIGSTAESVAALHPVAPDEQEDMGPVPGLFKAVSAKAAAEVTGDEAYYAQEAELGVEHENIEAGQIIGFALAIAAAIAVIVLLLFQWTAIAGREAERQAVELSGYPLLRETQTNALQKLTQYEVIDEEQGVYRIPIDQAMTLMVNEAYEQPEGAYAEELRMLRRD